MVESEKPMGMAPVFGVLATRLRKTFHEWIQLDPLAPCPHFTRGPVGTDRGLPRFGVSQEGTLPVINIDPSLAKVAAAVILREVVATFIPSGCLVDITYDAINRFAGAFLAGMPVLQDVSWDSPHWHALVRTHTRRYTVHYLGAPVTLDLDVLPRSQAFFRIFLGKLRQHATRIPPGQAGEDIVAIIVRSITSTLWEHSYKPEDAEFFALMANHMHQRSTFPTPRHLAGQTPGWPSARCTAVARRLREDPVSPTYQPDPRTLGLCFCWVLLETPPVVDSHAVRTLTFLPFASLTCSQCVGTPLPTYFLTYFLPPNQLDELGVHLGELKQAGILLDFQILRGERSLDILNWNETLAVLTPAPIVSQVTSELTREDRHGPIGGLAKAWPQSWLVQQALQYYGLRQYNRRALSHLDPRQNYQAFLVLIEDAAFLTSADIPRDLAPVLPLLEWYRNVEYVIRVLGLAQEFLHHLFDHPREADAKIDPLGKMGLVWERFPARDWVLGLFRDTAGDITRQKAILDTLALGARLLQFFAPFTIPPDVPPVPFLAGKQRALVVVIKGDLAKIPVGEKERRVYFRTLHDRIVGDRLLAPRISLGPIFRPSVEDFYLFARSPRQWAELAEGFTTRFPLMVYACSLMQVRDARGDERVAGIIRATQAQFQSIRHALVGPKGILGPGASLLVGRRVPSWDMFRRNFVETFDSTTGTYTPIKDYLSLVRAELLAGWTRPRSMPLPYTRKILDEPYLGPVEHLTRPPPDLVQLTPDRVALLRASFLSGHPAFHHLVARRLLAREGCDLNWPAYGLERYFLHVYLSTRQPRYIFTHLITPATRRVLASSAVSGFQTIIIEYLWPKGAPDDAFLRYLYSRTEKNVLAYSVHRVVSDTRFFNLDRIFSTQEPATGPSALGTTSDTPDAVDMRVFMIARPQDHAPAGMAEFSYSGDTRHAPGSAGWALARDYLAGTVSRDPRVLPPESVPVFEFDPRAVGFTEKVALVFRGEFDALPLCQSLPFGHHYRTEEIAYSSAGRLAGQPGHLILFDFPPLQASQLDAFLDDFLRDPAVVAHSVASYLVEQNLALVDGVALARVNPLEANPFDPAGGHYIHLPKRKLEGGKWHTLSLLEQKALLNKAWTRH